MTPTEAPQLDWMDWRNDISLITDLLPEKVKGFDLEKWAVSLTERPAHNTLAVVGLASVLFYLAERGHNPKVREIWDATVYCSTCISVGYGDIFAHTPVGKIIGSVLMTIGPALANASLNGGRTSGPDLTQEQTLATLQQILAELKKLSSAPHETPSA